MGKKNIKLYYQSPVPSIITCFTPLKKKDIMCIKSKRQTKDVAFTCNS